MIGLVIGSMIGSVARSMIKSMLRSVIGFLIGSVKWSIIGSIKCCSIFVGSVLPHERKVLCSIISEVQLIHCVGTQCSAVNRPGDTPAASASV